MKDKYYDKLLKLRKSKRYGLCIVGPYSGKRAKPFKSLLKDEVSLFTNEINAFWSKIDD